MKNVTRREFVGRMGRRAVYTMPGVLAVFTERAYAGVSGCGQDGSVCTKNSDCCSGWQCLDDMQQMVSMGELGTCQ